MAKSHNLLSLPPSEDPKYRALIERCTREARNGRVLEKTLVLFYSKHNILNPNRVDFWIVLIVFNSTLLDFWARGKIGRRASPRQSSANESSRGRAQLSVSGRAVTLCCLLVKFKTIPFAKDTDWEDLISACLILSIRWSLSSSVISWRWRHLKSSAIALKNTALVCSNYAKLLQELETRLMIDTCQPAWCESHSTFSSNFGKIARYRLVCLESLLTALPKWVDCEMPLASDSRINMYQHFYNQCSRELIARSYGHMKLTKVQK